MAAASAAFAPTAAVALHGARRLRCAPPAAAAAPGGGGGVLAPAPAPAHASVRSRALASSALRLPLHRRTAVVSAAGDDEVGQRGSYRVVEFNDGTTPQQRADGGGSQQQS
eukprot:CAMPEP_0197595548 /NCGR_PEP_ID=MMETSP1326-20131121/23086_1 /TAXON_ID=1155430 /ORGANISM="Genus nov. species nov., Strain RCC2288" /LENGTH=110 /DNA_ID=CAMNT_0043161923 /DNA_START=128 /DNA_END=456 /DNA_ORIENTATION=-